MQQPWTRKPKFSVIQRGTPVPASDANPAKWIASEKEEQGSERSFRHKAEAEFSGLCDDAIPHGGQSTQPWTRKGRPLLRHPREDSPASDANTAKRIASEKEEQGSERSFRRKAEAESSGLCDDAIPLMVLPG